eukprot:m.478572 g.478572  ORF g.478572 m.478572 type:complete len:438 (-) comp21167_c0_seq1:1734-3047(-)
MIYANMSGGVIETEHLMGVKNPPKTKQNNNLIQVHGCGCVVSSRCVGVSSRCGFCVRHGLVAITCRCSSWLGGRLLLWWRRLGFVDNGIAQCLELCDSRLEFTGQQHWCVVLGKLGLRGRLFVQPRAFGIDPALDLVHVCCVEVVVFFVAGGVLGQKLFKPNHGALQLFERCRARVCLLRPPSHRVTNLAQLRKPLHINALGLVLAVLVEPVFCCRQLLAKGFTLCFCDVGFQDGGQLVANVVHVFFEGVFSGALFDFLAVVGSKFVFLLNQGLDLRLCAGAGLDNGNGKRLGLGRLGLFLSRLLSGLVLGGLALCGGGSIPSSSRLGVLHLHIRRRRSITLWCCGFGFHGSGAVVTGRRGSFLPFSRGQFLVECGRIHVERAMFVELDLDLDFLGLVVVARHDVLDGEASNELFAAGDQRGLGVRGHEVKRGGSGK